MSQRELNSGTVYIVYIFNKLVALDKHLMVPFICHEISVLTFKKLYRATLCAGEVQIPIYGSDSSIIMITWVRNGVYQLSPAQCLIIH